MTPPVTLDLTREDHRQEALAEACQGTGLAPSTFRALLDFERIDHPHRGRCAQGHGRYWLWDMDRRGCNDFNESEENHVLNARSNFRDSGQGR